MNNDQFNQDDPTEPIQYPQQPQQPTDSPYQNQQGKLVLGSFQDLQSQKRTNRRPYQYPPQPQQPPAQQGIQQPGVHPQAPQSPQQHRHLGFPGQSVPAQQNRGSGQPGYPGAPGQNAYPQLPPLQQSGNRGQQASPLMSTPTVHPVNPGARPYSNVQSKPPAGGPTPDLRPRRRLGRRPGCMLGCLGVLLLLCVVGGFAIIPLQRVMAFGSAISTQAPLSSQTGYMNTSDRVNILVMGYGGGNHDGANLTDSMLVMSLLPPSHHTTLVSVPRDLWVQVPSGSGNYQKINAVYEAGSNNGANPASGGDAAAQKVSVVTGLDVKYWLTINFQGFRELIDSIGGIDVYVPDSFTANYPKNDDPSIDASWIKIQFKKGMQHMNGETAIRYARARYVLDNAAEGSDFARSARQQIIIKAALSKVKQMSTWPSMFNALTALQHTIYTNLSMADLMQFALKMDLDHAHRVGLSNQNVLVDSTAPDGGYILLPANNNWQGIVDYVKQQLYN